MNITIPDPDNPFGSPAYDGPAQDAHQHLTPGVYTATTDQDETVTVSVTAEFVVVAPAS